MSQIKHSDQASSIAEALSLRIGEQVSVAPWVRPEVTPYAVMLAPVPALPQPANLDSVSLCVIGAQVVDGVWQWMQLSPQSKELVGRHMEANDCAAGVWHALLVERAGGVPCACCDQPSTHIGSDGVPRCSIHTLNGDMPAGGAP